MLEKHHLERPSSIGVENMFLLNALGFPIAKQERDLMRV